MPTPKAIIFLPNPPPSEIEKVELTLNPLPHLQQEYFLGSAVLDDLTAQFVTEKSFVCEYDHNFSSQTKYKFDIHP